MVKKKHESDKIVEDIVGGFRIFLISILVVYFSIAIINALPNVNFPISTSSWWIPSFIIGLFITFVSYIKKKNKNYFS